MKLRRRRRVKAFPQKRSQLGGCGLLPENGVWGHAPPSAFGRAAASPQTRQMRCWPPPTEVIKAPVKGNLCAYWEQQDSWRDLPSTAEKQDVSSAGFQGIFSPFTQRYSDISVCGGITTLGVCFMPSKRWARRGHGGLISSLSCTRSPSALRAHTAAHRGKHGAFSLPETSTGSIGSTA